MAAGVPARAPLSRGNSLHESYVCWNEGAILVEMLEQAETGERRMTKAAVRELEKEFAELLNDPSWEHARTLFPEEAIVREKELHPLNPSRTDAPIKILEKANSYQFS